ncbi:MAG: hypothetical protein SH856_08945 [Flavobacteriales bacterium]|nr:hypothetical protein [Flavobacteriales bacterium]
MNGEWKLAPLRSAFCALAFFLFAESISAQAKANLLKGKQWWLAGAGVSNADYQSYMVGGTFSKRSDYIITSYRMYFSQELVAGPHDSCTVSKSRNLEAGLLWGDALAGKKGYLSATAGMGLNHRWYCDDGDPGEFRKVTRLTIGVPIQLDAGINLSGNMKLGIAVVANWNFLEPYVGSLLTLSWWSDAKRN